MVTVSCSLSLIEATPLTIPPEPLLETEISELAVRHASPILKAWPLSVLINVWEEPFSRLRFIESPLGSLEKI